MVNVYVAGKVSSSPVYVEDFVEKVGHLAERRVGRRSASSPIEGEQIAFVDVRFKIGQRNCYQLRYKEW